MPLKLYRSSICECSIFRMLLVGPLLILTFYALWTTFDSPPQILNDRMSKSAPVLETVLTVKLLKPLHRFHSDHWFHMAEYYLSNNNRTTCAAALINSGPSVVIIIAPKDPRFLEKLTKVAFFMLLLSFTDENMRTVLVVNHDFIPPDQVSRQGFQDFTPKRNLRLSVFSLAFDTMLQYDLTRPINDRFTPLYKHPSRPFSEHGKVSSIMDTITAGRTPMSSGRWFHSRDQVGRFRSKIARLCGCHNHSSLSPSWSSTTTTVTAAPRADCNSFSQSQSLRAAQPDILVSRKFNGSLLPFSLAIMRPLSDQLRLGGIRRYRMVIYERNSDRRFADLEGTLELLSEYTNGQKDTVSDDIIIWDIDIIYHSDEMNPCLLNAALRSADILITTHGFQSTALIFMKSGAVLIEVFPYKYFKESYVKLSASYGIHHRRIQNISPTSLTRQALRFIPLKMCMLHRRCRSHARGDNVQVTSDDLQFILKVTREVQDGVIGEHNAPYEFQ